MKKKSSVKRTPKNTLKNTVRKLQQQNSITLAKFQADCSHLQGCHQLGSYASSLTSIVWHRLDTGREIGLCTNCGRKFDPTDKDYAFWRKSPCGNIASAAYQPPFNDNGKRAGITPSHQEIGTTELFIDDYYLEDGTFLSTDTLPGFLAKYPTQVSAWLVIRYPRFIRELLLSANQIIKQPPVVNL